MSLLRVPLLLLFLVALVGGGTAAYATTGPVVRILSPAPELFLRDPGTRLMVTGRATTDGAEPVERVEVSTDGGLTWTTARGGAAGWLAGFTPPAAGRYVLLARAVTASTTGDAASVVVQIGTPLFPPLPVTCECVLDLADRPLVPHDDTQPVELGLRFTNDRDGYLTGAVIRRGAYTGELVVRVYWSDGRLRLETTAPPATGVQRVVFPSALPLLQWSPTVLSYYTPAGGYAASHDYFDGLLVQAPFRVSGGYYRYGAGGGFPDQAHRNSNYWITPVFDHQP